MISLYLDEIHTVTEKFSEEIPVCFKCNASNTQRKLIFPRYNIFLSSLLRVSDYIVNPLS